MWFATNCSPVEQQIALYLHAVLAVKATDYCQMETQVAFRVMDYMMTCRTNKAKGTGFIQCRATTEQRIIRSSAVNTVTLAPSALVKQI